MRAPDEFPENNPVLGRQEVEQHRPRLNHIGISCSSEAEYEAAVSFFTSIGLKLEVRPAEDHQRVFISLPSDTELELQLWNIDQGIQSRNFRAHFDVESTDPMTTLNKYGEAMDWGETEIPRGGVKISDHLMVMARPTQK